MNRFLVIQYTPIPSRSLLKVQNIESIINRSGIYLWYGYFLKHWLNLHLCLFQKNGYFLPVSGLRAFHPSTSILCVNPSLLRPFVSSSSIHLGKVSEAMFSNPKIHFHGLNFKHSFPLYNYITRSGTREDPSQLGYYVFVFEIPSLVFIVFAFCSLTTFFFFLVLPPHGRAG
uniref:Uncharacterized protein n=1 Tax=Populus trichocarpa TaxID=3694 RepID=A0A2K2BM83_POPTR